MVSPDHKNDGAFLVERINLGGPCLSSVEDAIAAWGEGEATAVLALPGELTAFIGESIALTDDFAPVDQLLGR